MTADEVIAKLNALGDDDPERSHTIADILLVQFLSTNGFDAVAKAFADASERAGFWYA